MKKTKTFHRNSIFLLNRKLTNFRIKKMASNLNKKKQQLTFLPL